MSWRAFSLGVLLPALGGLPAAAESDSAGRDGSPPSTSAVTSVRTTGRCSSAACTTDA